MCYVQALFTHAFVNVRPKNGLACKATHIPYLKVEGSLREKRRLPILSGFTRQDIGPGSS